MRRLPRGDSQVPSTTADRFEIMRLGYDGPVMRWIRVVSVGALLLAAACSQGVDTAKASEAVQKSASIAGTGSVDEADDSGTLRSEPSDSPARSRLVINAAGDTNLDSNYLPVFLSEGYGHAFSGLGNAFIDDDLTIVNLECAASDRGIPVTKAFTFNCDLDALPVMRDAGVEVVNLANNHSADFGDEALLDTKAKTAAAGLAPVGVGANIVEASEPALFEINGWTIAVLGFNGVVPSADWIAGPDDPGAADGDNAETMAAAVAAADEVADLVFVTVHWGVELDTSPRPEDVERARAMIDAGADGVFGHHPHRLQPLEFYNDRPIAWSLGNFVWPRLSVAGATTAIARVVIEPDGTVSACLIPVEIVSNGHPVIQGEPPQRACPA